MRSIFVSSTFQDMQAERDVLRQKVFPAINREASLHNDHIEFIDLRWGIDTLGHSEQDAGIKVMNVCLNELRRSDDLMIILLGDRYGWIPDSDFMRQLQIKHDLSWEMDQMSATAFEIEHGVLFGDKKALVYIREFTDTEQADIPSFFFEENADNRRRIEELKERLKNSPNCKIHTYPAHFVNGGIAASDMDALSERMIKDLQDVYCREWADFDRMPDHDREQGVQWGFIDRKAKGFCARKGEADSLIRIVRSWILEPSSGKGKMRALDHMHFVIGPSGSGKSTLLSEVAIRLRQEGCDVLPFIGGLTAKSSDAMSILKGISYYLEERLGVKHKPENGAGDEDGTSEKGTQARLLSNDKSKEPLQARLVETAAEYAKDHKPLIVVIDAIDQLYPDGNRDEFVFCPGKLNGSIRFLVTCTPNIRTGAAAKTILDDLNEKDRLLIARSALDRRNKEISNEVLSTLLKKKGAESPLYISMVIDRLMLMDRNDYQAINEKGGGSKAITLHQKEIIEALPDGLSEMAVALFDAAGNKIGQPFTQKALEYLAVSRKGLRESDLAYCMEDDWDYADFSNLLFYLDDQFLTRTDGRVDFVHKILRQGVLSKVQDESARHLKLEWRYHQCDTEDPVRATELLYHCYCTDDFKYAQAVVKPIVFQDYSKDEDVLAVTNKRYSQTLADLAMTDQGAWIDKWLQALVKDARKDNDPKKDNRKWNSLWTVLWFLNSYVLHELPDTQSGYETGGAITHFMKETVDNAENGTWSEINIKYVKDEIQRKRAGYLRIAGHEWEARIERKRIFEKTRAYYESLQEKNYADWCQMFKDSYIWLAYMKGSSDWHVLSSALEPAAYAIGMLSESTFVEKNLDEDGCLIGMLYGCIGEVCQNLNAFLPNLVAYEQDLRYREEIYKRQKSADALRSYSGSYHNISIVYGNIGLEGKDDFDALYSGDPVFLKDEKYPLRLLPFTRFNSETEETEGEMFMELCHCHPPVIARLMARDRQIELIEMAIGMNPEAKWNNDPLEVDNLWYNYWFAGVLFFEGMQEWDPTDDRQEYFRDLSNIRTALKRLCKALEYSWERFFDDPTYKTSVTILTVENTFVRFIERISFDREGVFRTFEQQIKKGEEFLRSCMAKDCERRLDGGSDGNIVSEDTKLARFLLVYNCVRSAQIVMDCSHSEQDENMVLQWCDKVKTYLPGITLWINFDDSANFNPKVPFTRILDLETCRSECDRIQDLIRKHQQERANDRPIYSAQPSAKNSNSCGQNPGREGFFEVGLPGGGRYKGEWKAGKQNGYGIETDVFGNVKCGVFENGNLKKRLPKAVVALKLMKF